MKTTYKTPNDWYKANKNQLKKHQSEWNIFTHDENTPKVNEAINGTSSPYLLEQFDKTEEELLSYTKLTKGWDGYQGIAPNEDIINSSRNFLKLVKSQNLPAPKPMLSGEGEVSLYWDIDNTYIEVGFEEEMFFSYLIDSVDKTIGEDDVKFENDILPNNLFLELTKLSKI